MSNQTELPWLAEARQHIGLTEIAGKQHNSIIGNWLISLKAWWTDDETPWCGTFVAHCARTAGRDLPQHWYRALDWQNTGTRLNAPAYGCVVVFSRAGGGHVGFCVRLLCETRRAGQFVDFGWQPRQPRVCC
ncbi:TIGR02594 family protein [Kingella kingae]|nr:TIGR02594 family protein [Kingella kingae]MDK4611284.1 TIGR02594 family protein [Kingella kingae]